MYPRTVCRKNGSAKVMPDIAKKVSVTAREADRVAAVPEQGDVEAAVVAAGLGDDEERQHEGAEAHRDEDRRRQEGEGLGGVDDAVDEGARGPTNGSTRPGMSSRWGCGFFVSGTT